MPRAARWVIALAIPFSLGDLAVVGCQRPAPEPTNTPAVPVAVAPPPLGGAGDPRPVGEPASEMFIPGIRLDGTDPLTVAEATELLNIGGDGRELMQVVKLAVALGARLYPAFEEMLNGPTSSESDQAKVLGFAGVMKGDRSRFMPHAVRRLSNESGEVRRAAVTFLGCAGSEREAALVTVMLLDKDSTVQYAAADALVKIGGEREVAVFDLILHNARRYEDDGFLILGSQMIEVYEQCRDELKAKLKKQEEGKKPQEKK